MVLDLSHQTFGSWTVLSKGNKDAHNARMWLCRCVCGIEREVRGTELFRGVSKSCGCSKIKPSMWGTRIYKAWIRMKTRCYNPNYSGYANYGGRGIKVCERWLNSFETFMADMGVPTDAAPTLDRIDPDDHYYPENCRWVDTRTQCQNRRNLRLPDFVEADWPYDHSHVLRLMKDGLDRQAIIRHAEKMLEDFGGRKQACNRIREKLRSIKESKYFNA